MPGIEEATSRMNRRFQGKRSIAKLPDHLQGDEQVKELAVGHYDDRYGLLALTDRRIIFLAEGWVRKAHEEWHAPAITGITFNSGLMQGSVTIHTPAGGSKIEKVDKADGKRLVEAARAAVIKRPVTETAEVDSPPKADPYEQLRKLGELREAGVVTEDEFESKKRELLNQI